MSLNLGPEFTTQGAKCSTRDPITHALLTAPPHTPVVCLTHCDSDEEKVADILRGVATERGVAYHHMDLVEGEKGLEKWCAEGGWMVVNYSHLLKNPQETWQWLSEVLCVVMCG